MQKVKFTKVEANNSFKVIMTNALAGEGMPPHIADKDAYLHVISGSITFTLDGSLSMISAGSGISIPKTQQHSFVIVDPGQIMLTMDINAKLTFV